MLRLALLSARGRLGTFAGAFVALAASAALVMAGGMPFQSALRTHPPVERYAGAAAVVTGQQIVGVEHDVLLGERARVDSALAAHLAAVPGARRGGPPRVPPAPPALLAPPPGAGAAPAAAAAPPRLGSRDSVAHGWSSAALTPYVLSAGRAPVGPGEAVTGYRARVGA